MRIVIWTSALVRGSLKSWENMPPRLLLMYRRRFTLGWNEWFLGSDAEHVLLIPSHIHVCAESECPLNCLNLSDSVTIPPVLGRQTIASVQSRQSVRGADSVVSTAPPWSLFYCYGVYRTNALTHTHLYSKWGPRIVAHFRPTLRWISCIEKNPRWLLISRICKKMFST